MKILKKIMPIATINSVVAIVAPLVTSCNSGNVIDGSKIFIPTVTQAEPEKEHESVTATEATQLYLKDTNNNNDVVIQDIKAAFSQIAYYDIYNTQEKQVLPKYNIKLNYSNFVVDCTQGSEKMSFEVNGSIKIENSTRFAEAINKWFVGSLPGIKDINLKNFNIKLTNVPYSMKYNFGWYLFAPALNPLDNRKEVFLPQGSSISLTTTGEIFGSRVSSWYSYENETYTLDEKNSFIETKGTKWAVALFIVSLATNIAHQIITNNVYSYHMANIGYRRG